MASIFLSELETRKDIFPTLRNTYHRKGVKYAIFTRDFVKAQHILGRGLSRSGIRPHDERTFAMSLREPTSKQAIVNWAPMHMTTYSVLDRFIVFISTQTNRLLVAYFRKIGYTIINHNIPKFEADINVEDLSQLIVYATDSLRVTGVNLELSEAIKLDRISRDPRRGVGHKWRSSFMSYAICNKLIYVGLGDEFESLANAQSSRIFSRHVVSKRVGDAIRKKGGLTRLVDHYMCRGHQAIEHFGLITRDIIQALRLSWLTGIPIFRAKDMFNDRLSELHLFTEVTNAWRRGVGARGSACMIFVGFRPEMLNIIDATRLKDVQVIDALSDSNWISGYYGQYDHVNKNVVNDIQHAWLMALSLKGLAFRYEGRDIFCIDAFTFMPLKANEFHVALFSLSNYINPKPRQTVAKLSTLGDDWIVSFPFRRGQPVSSEEVEHSGEFITEWYREERFRDWTATPEDFTDVDVNVWSGYEIECVYGHDLDGNRKIREAYHLANRSDPYHIRYMFVSSRIEHDTHQTWKNSQTQWARYVSVFLRAEVGLYEDSIYRIRLLAVQMMDSKAQPAEDRGRRVTARLSNGKYIAVSGHLVNLMLYSCVGVIDLRRYLRTVEKNIQMAANGTMDDETKLLIKRNVLAEDNTATTIRLLWHSFLEFYYAVATYVLMCKMFSLPFNPKLVKYVLNELYRWRDIYPVFSLDSMEVRAYVKN